MGKGVKIFHLPVHSPCDHKQEPRTPRGLSNKLHVPEQSGRLLMLFQVHWQGAEFLVEQLGRYAISAQQVRDYRTVLLHELLHKSFIVRKFGMQWPQDWIRSNSLQISQSAFLSCSSFYSFELRSSKARSSYNERCFHQECHELLSVT